MNIPQIHFTEEKIKQIEEQFNAKFLLVYYQNLANGRINHNIPSMLFYNEVPPEPTYSKFFQIFSEDRCWWIASGQPIFDEIKDNGGIKGLCAGNNFYYTKSYITNINDRIDYEQKCTLNIAENGELIFELGA